MSLEFPRLVVKVRDEIVSFGAPGELHADADGVIGGGGNAFEAEAPAFKTHSTANAKT